MTDGGGDRADDPRAVVAVGERGGGGVVLAVDARIRGGCQKFGIFDAKTTAAINAHAIAVMLAGNFQSFHGGIVGGATKFRLWLVTAAPALSRSALRICRACLNDSRALGRFPSQSAFVPF